MGPVLAASRELGGDARWDEPCNACTITRLAGHSIWWDWRSNGGEGTGLIGEVPRSKGRPLPLCWPSRRRRIMSRIDCTMLPVGEMTSLMRGDVGRPKPAEQPSSALSCKSVQSRFCVEALCVKVLTQKRHAQPEFEFSGSHGKKVMPHNTGY